jgi:hypothetical protein
MTGRPRAEDDGRLVPPYIVTGGRTHSSADDLALETLVTTTSAGMARADHHVFEQRRILMTCRDPMSIAEVAAELEVPAGVARVLVGDLVSDGMLRTTGPTDRNEQLIRRLIDGVRSL